jgi:hypothetical protein
MAMAEESQSFVAQNAARAHAFEQSQAEVMAKSQGATQAPQAAASQAKASEKDS